MRNFLLFILFCVVIACNNEKENNDTVFSQPPFDVLTDSIQQAPKNADLYYRRGVLLYQNNQLDYAEKDIRTAWQLYPKEEYALSLTTILKQKNQDSAIVFLQEALQKLPTSIALSIGLARGYQKKGEQEKSLAITDAILKQFPGQLDAITLKSELLRENDKKKSLAYLEQAHALVPSDPSVAYDLAYEYAESQNAKALTLTDSLIKAHAQELEKAYYVKGIYWENAGNSSEAIKNYEAAIRINYNFLDAYRDKGALLLDAKKYEDALKTFQLALKVAPASGEFYYLSGKVQEAMGNKENAKLNYERAYGLDKTLTEAKEAAEKLSH